MRALLIAVPFAWLVALVAAPVAIMLGIAAAVPADTVPPFTPPFAWTPDGVAWRGTSANLATILTDPHYREAFGRSLALAAIAAGLCLLAAYPAALGLRAAPARWRPLLLGLLLLPFWTGLLLRIAAWIGLLRDQGLINTLLLGAGLIEAPLALLYTDAALLLGLVHAYLPFAVLPLFAAVLRIDPALEHAAAVLGARPAVVFATVVLPLSLPGAAAAFLLVFIPAAGEFVIPELLGPPGAPLLGRVLWEEFFVGRDWPLAAALAVTLLAVLLVPIALFQRLEARP